MEIRGVILGFGFGVGFGMVIAGAIHAEDHARPAVSVNTRMSVLAAGIDQKGNMHEIQTDESGRVICAPQPGEPRK
jgi:hypothetical protein